MLLSVRLPIVLPGMIPSEKPMTCLAKEVHCARRAEFFVSVQHVEGQRALPVDWQAAVVCPLPGGCGRRLCLFICGEATARLAAW